ncbi:hypothetical protein GCM10010869_21680 [Mesorhizobium tianshanense]|nr:hypothetical protein GCM10010869_21680 [Mesorhizobium tianshanense]
MLASAFRPAIKRASANFRQLPIGIVLPIGIALAGITIGILTDGESKVGLLTFEGTIRSAMS